MESQFNQEELDAIREIANENDIIILESLGFSLPRYGDLRCECPIHGGDNLQGFSYSFRLKSWKCWTNGCHDKYGSGLIGLIMAIKRVGLGDAIKYIMTTTKYDINNLDSNLARIKSFISRNRKIEDQPTKIFSPELLKGLDHKVNYFLDQGFSPNVLYAFQAFYSGKRTHPLYNRACLPITNDEGQILGFTGRSLNDLVLPKWMHYPKNIGTSKILFRLDLAKDAIMRTKTAILVEGPKDVMRLHQVGIHNVVSPLGTNLHMSQIKLLHKYECQTLLLATDPDAAGSKASAKIADKCRLHFNVIDIGQLFKSDPGDTDTYILEKEIKPEILRIIEEESMKYV